MHGLLKTKQSLLETQDKRVSLFDGNDPKDIVRTIRRAASLSIGHHDSCLRRSLLLWWILRQQGVDSSMRVGVASQGGELLGHAWVEIGQKPINDRSNVRDTYQVIEHKNLH